MKRRNIRKGGNGVIKYVTILPFEVLDGLSKGKEIFVLDRERREVYIAGNLTVKRLFEMLYCDNSNGQYEFWREEVTKEV